MSICGLADELSGFVDVAAFQGFAGECCVGFVMALR
jgi:hypothetical protein